LTSDDGNDDNDGNDHTDDGGHDWKRPNWLKKRVLPVFFRPKP
jgi:hypothetical protein